MPTATRSYSLLKHCSPSLTTCVHPRQARVRGSLHLSEPKSMKKTGNAMLWFRKVWLPAVP